MNSFPHADPIPLPAPIWLFKLLHIVTLSLHFVAMQMLVGGLLIAVLLNLFGKSDSSATVAKAIGRRLTIVMTFLINFGVPPLLFTQVLYGRALYTSSVLIGAFWISVVFALMLAYWLLYRFSIGLEASRKVWWIGLIAWCLIGGIADVFRQNVELMVRPEVWQTMYSASPLGTHLPTIVPSDLPRFLCVLFGGFVAAGLWLLYLAGRKSFSVTDRHYLSALGTRIALVAGIFDIGAGMAVYHAQPAVVQASLNGNLLYRAAGAGWTLLMVLILIFAVTVFFTKSISALTSYSAIALGFLSIALLTVYRDGIRDMTLLSKGFDVWQQPVVTNWSVVGIFLVLFVGGLGVIAWLVSVVAGAQQISESTVQL